MSFDNQRKPSHSIHAVPSQPNIATTARRLNENLHLSSFTISQSQYPNSLEQQHPLTSCKNIDKGQLKLQDFQYPSTLSNSDIGILSSQNTNSKYLRQIAEKNTIKNKENNSYFGNLEGKENIYNNSHFEEKKRKSCSPLKSSQNNLVQSQNSNSNSSAIGKKDTKNDSTSRSRKDQHKNNLKMYKQPCQKNANRSRSSNPSRSNSRTPRNSKSPSAQSFNGANSMNQKPSYLRNVQSKIKDQIEFHKELKKNEAKLCENQLNHLNSQSLLKTNQDHSQSLKISPSQRFQNSLGNGNNQNFFRSQNANKDTSPNPSGIQNLSSNNLLIMDNFQTQSNTLSTLSNNSTKNSNTPINKLSQVYSNNQGQEISKSTYTQSMQNNQQNYPVNSNQLTQDATLQTSSNQISTMNQQQETLFTGHFRTKSNISEYQITAEDYNNGEHNSHLSHSALRHNQIKNMYNNSQNPNTQPQNIIRQGRTLDNSQHQQFRPSLERNKSQNSSPQRQIIPQGMQANPNQQQCVSPSNGGGQQLQRSFVSQRGEYTPSGMRRQSGIQDNFVVEQENKKFYHNQNQQQQQQQQFNNEQIKNQDQFKSVGKKNVLELATNFLKSPLMQQLCHTKQQQQPVQQNQVSYSNLMNGNIKQQHQQQKQVQQNDLFPNNQMYFSDNSRGFAKKKECLQKENNTLQQNTQNQQQTNQPQMSIQEQLQEQMKKLNQLPKKHPCDQTLTPMDLQQLLVHQNPNSSIISNYQSASFGNAKNYQSNHNIGQGQVQNINIQHNYCSSGNNPVNSTSNQLMNHQNGEQSMVASSLFSSFNPNNETKGFFQNDFEKRMNDLGKSSNSRKQQLSQNDASSNISFNAGDMSNNMIQPQVENPFY